MWIHFLPSVLQVYLMMPMQLIVQVLIFVKLRQISSMCCIWKKCCTWLWCGSIMDFWLWSCLFPDRSMELCSRAKLSASVSFSLQEHEHSSCLECNSWASHRKEKNLATVSLTPIRNLRIEAICLLQECNADTFRVNLIPPEDSIRWVS